jgi:CheY-like chemotaxis protein
MAAEKYKGRTSVRVLVCDDDPAMLSLMVRRLEKLGLTIDKASGGAEASTRIAEHSYDLLVTDIYMPEVTGLELLKQFKAKDPRGQVVVATASASLESAVEALNHGAFAYLNKPFDHVSVFDNVVSRAIDFWHLLLDNQRMAEAQRRRGDLLEEEVASRIRKLKGQQQYLGALVASLPVGIVVFDDKARVLVANPTAERLLGADLGDAGSLLDRLGRDMAAQDGVLRGDMELSGGPARLWLVDLKLEEAKSQRVLVLVDGDQTTAPGTMLAKSMGQLRAGLAWLIRQPLAGETGKMVRALFGELREVERLLGVSPVEREPAFGTGPLRLDGAPSPARRLLDRGRALMGRHAPAPTATIDPDSTRTELERSVRRWAGDAEHPNGGLGAQEAPPSTEEPDTRPVWPPPLPTQAER